MDPVVLFPEISEFPKKCGETGFLNYPSTGVVSGATKAINKRSFSGKTAQSFQTRRRNKIRGYRWVYMRMYVYVCDGAFLDFGWEVREAQCYKSSSVEE